MFGFKRRQRQHEELMRALGHLSGSDIRTRNAMIEQNDLLAKLIGKVAKMIEATAEMVAAGNNEMKGAMMSGFDNLRREVAETRAVSESAVALIEGIAERLRNVTSEAEAQALADELDTSAGQLAAAVAANTIANPSPVTETTPTPAPATGDPGDEG